jgi:hypothetical protein
VLLEFIDQLRKCDGGGFHSSQSHYKERRP